MRARPRPGPTAMGRPETQRRTIPWGRSATGTESRETRTGRRGTETERPETGQSETATGRGMETGRQETATGTETARREMGTFFGIVAMGAALLFQVVNRARFGGEVTAARILL